MKQFNKIVLDPFCFRQFGFNASSHIPCDPSAFQTQANQYYQTAPLHDGYAPFCKHVFIPNFAQALNCVVKITPQNQHLLRSGYEARTEKELPVLKRYFLKEEVEVKTALYLDLILYSKQQIQLENASMGNVDPHKDVDYDFGIVSVKPTDFDFETPMDPITMMRNALGKEHGGSGVQLKKELYMKSVKYWEQYALIK